MLLARRMLAPLSSAGYAVRMARILVVEDDVLTAQVIRDALTFHGYHVEVATDGEEGLALFVAVDFDLVLLDLVLPSVSGFEILAQMRLRSDTPIIILTARDEGEEKVTGLDLGADDYVTKPFRSDELLARVRARLRRPITGRAMDRVQTFGDVVIDLGARLVTVGGDQAHLTPTEFRLLEILVEHTGLTVRRDDLVLTLGGEEATEQALQTHVSRLRRKLGADGDRIKTAWGVGYRLAT